MFQHMFTSMNEMLDEITKQYPQASEQERMAYLRQVAEMKKMSDSFIEQWLDFEEKVADFQECIASDQPVTVTTSVMDNDADPIGQQAKTNLPVEAYPCSMADLAIPEEAEVLVNKGQGYYNLFMFSHAARLFHDAISIAPECNLARLYLGMSQMHMQNWQEAQRQFQLLIVLSDFPKWLALGYNALGCIHAVHMNIAQAEKLFRKAYEVYPSFTDSLNNLKSCQDTPGQLSLYFGSTELCCM
ncbi:hypothetical protein D3P07_07625 [Paenibacillus sp. 1011MAR3C5]|uniref:tetratricopeptide repeat protein n=1 Tax=Paenibacillus sp. 1011MAR3C5 TaxID=1675787 RepID=UPI000E6BD797|nr:hypothetical protein [Paenibacillus sp. 1011MAR3C5]RJE90079.1 hypothetical protein D3P07_07625 [Paenibacillus sp. 1011MAR3C5]